MGAAAVASAALAVGTTLCDSKPQEHIDTPPTTKEQPHLRRVTTKSGMIDPMTQYQQEVEKRNDQSSSKLMNRVGILQDPMTLYQNNDKVKGTSVNQLNEKIIKNKTFQQQNMTTEKRDEMNLKEEEEQLLKIWQTKATTTTTTTTTKAPLATSPDDNDDDDDEDNNINNNNVKVSDDLQTAFIGGMTPSEARLEESARKAKQHSGGIKVFSGNGNMALALEIARHLGIRLGKATVGRFADGEVNVVIKENVRGKDVYVVQPTCPPVNDNLMELLLMISTLRRASARRITVVIPYYGYARQDRKMQARVPISAADVARLMEAMGVDRVIAVDLHCGQIQGFFGPRVPVDNLDGGIVGLDYFGGKDLNNPVIVSPDAGGVYRAKKFKERLEQKYEMTDLGLAMIVKQRARAGTVDQMDLVGDVKGCDCIIVDDMIDTAGTLCKAADVLKANGASRVFAFASHGLLSGPGNERIAASQMEEVVVLNTIPTTPQREANEKLTTLSVAPLLAQAIFNIHAKKSVSALFK